jgi:demethylmenaquinone methyltransferase / 2-methoxy-6-polyprenyl-1,4-benzoquinol methylase
MLKSLADNSFDIITGSYALRNAADLREVLAEIQRLLKPGGHDLSDGFHWSVVAEFTTAYCPLSCHWYMT